MEDEECYDAGVGDVKRSRTFDEKAAKRGRGVIMYASYVTSTCGKALAPRA